MSVCVDPCWICGRKFYRSSNKCIFRSLPIFSCQRFLLVCVLPLSKLRSRMSENLIGSFFLLIWRWCRVQASEVTTGRSDQTGTKKSDFKIIVTGLDRERIKIGTDFTPCFVRFGNFIHYVAHYYKFLFMTLLIDRIDWSLYKILPTLLIIQAQYSNLPLKLTLKWVYHILHHTMKRLNVGKWGWCTVDKLLFLNFRTDGLQTQSKQTSL